MDAYLCPEMQVLSHKAIIVLESQEDDLTVSTINSINLAGQ